MHILSHVISVKLRNVGQPREDVPDLCCTFSVHFFQFFAWSSGCNVVRFCRRIPTLWRTLLPPCSLLCPAW